MNRRTVDILAIALIWVLMLTGAVLLAQLDDPTTDDVGVAVALAGVVGFILTGLFLGLRRRRPATYVTGFVVPVILSWLLAGVFVGGFGSGNTTAGLILWPILFAAWLVLRRLVPIPRGGWGWQIAVIVIGLIVGNIVSDEVTTNDVVEGLAIGGTWVGLHVARLAFEVHKQR